MENNNFSNSQPPIIEGKEPDSDLSYEWVNQMQEINKLEKGIPIFNFAEGIKDRKQDMEFRVIRKITETVFHNNLLQEYSPETNKHNRYNNIIPYKHSIISNIPDSFSDQDDEFSEVQNQDGLNGLPSKASTYINANFINDCFNRKKIFIATQGPMKNTIANFWKMVWYSDVKSVVMLCRLIEQERVECDQYWPDNQDEQRQPLYIGQFTINIEDEQIKDKLIIRKLNISKEEDDQIKTKIVIQYHWLGWPDHGVPDDDSYETLEEIIDIMVQNANLGKKTVVHCSAGVGRTGTILSLVNLTMTLQYFAGQIKQLILKQLDINQHDQSAIEAIGKISQKLDLLTDKQKDEFRISIFGTVRRLREQRWGMVYTNVQYSYLYKYMENAIKKILNNL
ncbi:hypothetical protein ABPG72_000319 [Tetrahymena utriculariae]